MSSIFITLDSRLAKKDSDPTATGSRYRVRFNNGGLKLNNPDPNKYEWRCALHSAKIWNSIPNISSKFNNNVLKYRRNNADPWIDITFPDGIYNPSNLDAFIKQTLFDAGHYGGTASSPVFAFTLDINISTSKFVFKFLDPSTTGESGATNYSVRIPANMDEILGFNANTILDINDSLSTRSSPNTPNITYDVDEISINLSIVESSYKNNLSNQTIEIYSPDVQPGGLIQLKPSSKVYIPVTNQRSIESILVYLEDNLGREVNLRNEQTVITIELKLMKRYG